MICSRNLSAFALAAAVAASSVLAGCHQEHLSANHGRAYATWFAAQRVNRAPEHPEQARRNMEGLDAQEAAVVSRSYRRASSKGDEGSEAGGRMLMVSPGRGGEATPYIPPPSVPMP